MQRDYYSLPKPTDPAPADALVERYLAGECLLDEQAAMERWIAANPRPGLAWKTMRAEGMAESTGTHVHIDVKAAEQQLIAALDQPESSHRKLYPLDSFGTRRRHRSEYNPEGGVGAAMNPRRQPTRIYRRFVSTWHWSAVALVVAVAGVIGGYGVIPSLLKRDSVSSVAYGVQYITATGQQSVFILPDGSRVTLAPQTKLELNPEFGRASRLTTLDGEAYFEVAPDTRVPFLIHTGRMTTRVLGTAFSVRRYTEESEVRVDVYSGRVAVSTDTSYRSSVILTAGVVGIVSDTTATTAVMEERSRPAWIDGQLVFNKAPLETILAAMARWYGYEFYLMDSLLLEKDLTVWISTGSYQEAFATLQLALNADLSLNGNVVTLKPRSAAQNAAPLSNDLNNAFSSAPGRLDNES